MGTAITERVLQYGYAVAIWNRSPEKAVPLLKLGAVWSDNPIRDCDRVILSLYSSDIVAEVIELMQSGLRPSQCVIDTTTGEPDDCIAMGQRLATYGVHYLDAPLSSRTS